MSFKKALEIFQSVAEDKRRLIGGQLYRDSNNPALGECCAIGLLAIHSESYMDKRESNYNDVLDNLKDDFGLAKTECNQLIAYNDLDRNESEDSRFERVLSFLVERVNQENIHNETTI